MRPDDRAEIARRFKALRRQACLTQLRLAGLIGIGRQALWDIEHERTLPHYATWDRFAALEAKAQAAPAHVTSPLAIKFPSRYAKAT